MPNSTLGNSIIDGLVPAIDGIRSSVFAAAGNRQYAVTIIRRQWSGADRGVGSLTTLSSVTLAPAPEVIFTKSEYALRDQGREAEAEVELRGVSLAYDLAELVGPALAANEEFLYQIADAQGQHIAPENYVLAGSPTPDRERDIGWVIKLRRTEAP